VGIENPVHLLFLGIVALVVLGPKRLPELARALGKGVREFREAISLESAPSTRQHAAEPPEAVAETPAAHTSPVAPMTANGEQHAPAPPIERDAASG